MWRRIATCRILLPRVPIAAFSCCIDGSFCSSTGRCWMVKLSPRASRGLVRGDCAQEPGCKQPTAATLCSCES